MTEGTVRWFDTDRGFGFIALGEGADDLYVHASEILSGDATKVLREGQVVEFEIGEGDRGPQARAVRVTADRSADAPLGVLGTVSWYEPSKGYGFITPDGGGDEIFLHSTAIVGDGVVSEGQRVAFLVVDGQKGPQADHLLPLGAEAGQGAATSDCADGTVSWFDEDKGFGFIAADSGGPDVFVHARALPDDLPVLDEGDRVMFDVVESERGPQARDVRLAGGSSRGRRPAPAASRPRSGRRDAPGGAPQRDARGPGRGDARGAAARGGEGVVARYDAERGFGFITPDAGGADLFVHVSVLRDDEGLLPGDRVRYQVRQSDRGPQAERVERI
ncbi:cold-shock protein [Serinicoccus sp. CNJ-927]|uniref:cold shock domain-containing protein n=1 Tax=Serinicoccus sp. CNJ-927 TaxID=1904970 RepID=UPI000969E382|nr:cold shock domain-containing protein [Serinicoccus sp. CNJ-927]OLT44532.1 cold-shock protein [Serinicoccus sp. CNJ-927]